MTREVRPIRSPFFPVRCKSLALPLAACYHWPMSHEQLISQAIHLPLPPRLRSSEFPKWNKRRRFLRFPASRSPLACPERNRRATRHCLSNRHSYEKLEPLVSHRKHSLGLTSNRHKTALHPRCSPILQRAEPRSASVSNRKTYEKLELDVTPIKPITSIFLIVRKTHFIQGEPAQFPCSSALLVARHLSLVTHFCRNLQPYQWRGRLIGRSALNGGAA